MFKNVKTFFKNIKCKWKRIRRRPKGKPNLELYKIKKEALGLLEQQSEKGNIDLYYGDATQVSEEGYVPYGWQFEDEDVHIECQKGEKMNYFGILSRSNNLIYQATKDNINADFIVQFMDKLSLKINMLTVVVLDNASVHTAKKVKNLLDVWEKRGLYLFFLPAYSPQLNIIERFWKELKEGWIKPSDYKSADSLFYAVNRIFAEIGTQYCINFSKFNQIKI